MIRHKNVIMTYNRIGLSSKQKLQTLSVWRKSQREMGRINLQSESTTLRLSPARKAKAHALAESLNLSLAQFIELLIDRADSPESDEQRIRSIVREELEQNIPKILASGKYPKTSRPKKS
jgi:hypothetical protein